MNCLEFRRRVGAEPSLEDEAVAAHRAECPTCARYQAELRAMDEVLARAMRIDVRRNQASLAPAVATPATALADRRPGPASSRWLAVAASLVLAVLVASTLWVSFPEPTLAEEVIGHVLHEPDAWRSSRAIDEDAVQAVLDPSGVHLKPGAATVSYAMRCRFAGRWVPHLVVQTDSGPVTVLLLTHRTIDAPERMVEDRGYRALVLPAPRGSIAVVAQPGRETQDIGAIARQVFDAVEWDA